MSDDVLEQKRDLVARLYNNTISVALFTHRVLGKGTSAQDLSNHNPSFPKIAALCKSLISDIKNHQSEHENFHSELSAGKELLEILTSIVVAIDDTDNNLLNDNAYHLEEYLEINKFR